jgi:hypothetical protein
MARLDHLLGLGVEFTSNEEVAAWVGSPYQDHARVSFALQIGKSRPKTAKEAGKEWYQKLSLKQWRGISHKIDEPLRVLAKQSLDSLAKGEGDVALARRKMIASRIEAEKEAMPVIPEEQQARLPFCSKEQQLLLRKKSRMEAALREAMAGQGMSLTQLACMYDLGLLHKGGDKSDKPSDWRPIGLLNVCIQLVHHVINYRLTVITEAENLLAPGQDGGRAERGVDLNQLNLDWITSEAQRLKRRDFRIDVDCKNAFNSMSQSAMRAVLRACNQNADQLGSLAGPSLLTVYVGVVECAPASPYTYSSSTHRFPDERTPIEAMPLSATSAEL